MRTIHIGLILAGLTLFIVFAGCSTSPARHSPAQLDASMQCGPEGCPIPDASGKIVPRPTTRPSFQMSPIRPGDLSLIPSKG